MQAQGSGPVMVNNMGSYEKPGNLIDLLSQIELRSSMERMGVPLPEGSVTKRMILDYYNSGMRISIFSTLFLALVSPLAVSVILDKLPLFSVGSQGLISKIYVILLCIGFSLGYAVFIGDTFKNCYIPYASKKLINWFMSGYTTGTLLTAVLIFATYALIYHNFDDHFIHAVFSKLAGFLEISGISRLAEYLNIAELPLKIINVIYFLVLGLRSVLIESGLMILGSGVSCVMIVYGYIFIGNKKLELDDDDE